MSGLAAAAAVATTLAATAWLAATDPKRRRAFRLPPFRGRRRPRLALCAALVPGVLLLWTGNGAGFLIWLGVCSVAGWATAAVPPARTARAAERLAATAAGIGKALRVPGGGARSAARAAARIDALERRVAALEAALAAAALGERDPMVARLADYQAARAAQRAGDA
ncbi:MAG: hypothetical protein RLO51_25800 [Thalassobaculum sp.]|uniref:hypothetical protein n=1 Tax=Thalassobaculum sp. TaxID=2022740 RepID=UPI0032ED7F9C